MSIFYVTLKTNNKITVEYSYDGKFEQNIFSVGQTGCVKTTFIRKIRKNNSFGELKIIVWLSKIPLSPEREKNISTCFKKLI